MEAMLSTEVQAGLDAARMASLRKASRLRLEADGASYKVLRLWKTGFSLEAENAPHLRGLVDIYDGGFHTMQCLIVASEEEGGEIRFDFKRATVVLDFERAKDAPIALLGGQSG